MQLSFGGEPQGTVGGQIFLLPADQPAGGFLGDIYRDKQAKGRSLPLPPSPFAAPPPALGVALTPALSA